ncbi:MAG TPA: glycine cleavage system protein GcvH [Deltaproteobacteria bacterium]|nr:MAG: glycine cleavage system protein GcvH [Deltaproteobacteria bacterium]HDM32491.1 glycine cleavage system protein GcvH [Deltaproteobacteria bacterium]
MKFPEDLKYTKDHEWGRPDGNRLIAGITDYAQDELGDIVYIELNDKGSSIKQGEVFGTVESVKAVSELYAPASGTIVEINEALLEAPEIINKDPYGDGWMIVIEMEDRAELNNLMDSQEYRTYVEKEAK